jgi:hypothetical protein
MYTEDARAQATGTSENVRDVHAGPAPYTSQRTGAIASPIASLIATRDFSAAAVDFALRTETLQLLGTLDDLYAVVGYYFGSVHQRFTLLSKSNFMARLPGFETSGTADVAALCLAMNVAVQPPQDHGVGGRSSHYVHFKSVMGVLDALGRPTLHAIQSRLLCAFYEMGHGMLLEASVSIAACARMAQFIRLDVFSQQDSADGPDPAVNEERRRLWWALVCLDRWVPKLHGQNT